MNETGLTLTDHLKQIKKEMTATATDTGRHISQQIMDELNQLNVVESSLKVGDRAPLFELPDAQGKVIKLASLLEEGPVVVSFFRGSWCSFCTAELRALQQNLFDIMQLKSSLVAISPQTPDKSLLTVEKNGLTFEVLVDSHNKVAHQFGIAFKMPELMKHQLTDGGVDPANHNGDESFELPIPATYVADTDGIIKYAFVEPDYAQRADPVEIIGVLRRLKK